MFIARSTARIRFTRTVFVLVAILPCAGLVSWAVHRRSPGHREAVRLEWQRAVGVPLSFASVEHPRPGVIRAIGCRLATEDGLVEAPEIEVETVPAEVRLRISRLVCDAAAARLLGALVADWLVHAARHPQDCVVEVADFAWAMPSPAAPAALRVECVTRSGARAVRVVRQPAAGGRIDEVRIVRTTAEDDSAESLEVDGTCSEPVPLAIVAAALGLDVAAIGPAAAVGTLRAFRDGDRWRGGVEGRVDGIDLAACTARLQGRASGDASALIRRLEWADGRIRDAEIECMVGPGRVEQRLLDLLVGGIGCRPGPAFHAAAAAPERTFEIAGWVLRADPRGIEIVSGRNLAGALAMSGGRAIIVPPAAVLAAERLAWLLTPPGAVSVPSAGPGAWLLDVMPRPERAMRQGDARGF